MVSVYKNTELSTEQWYLRAELGARNNLDCCIIRFPTVVHRGVLVYLYGPISGCTHLTCAEGELWSPPLSMVI